MTSPATTLTNGATAGHISMGFAPIVARAQRPHGATEPVAHDCAKVIVIRAGSAILITENDQRLIAQGDVVLIGWGVPCANEPEGEVIATALHLDPDYLVDQVFWQHSSLIADGTRPWPRCR